jgi:hypothetical protein
MRWFIIISLNTAKIRKIQIYIWITRVYTIDKTIYMNGKYIMNHAKSVKFRSKIA